MFEKLSKFNLFPEIQYHVFGSALNVCKRCSWLQPAGIIVCGYGKSKGMALLFLRQNKYTRDQFLVPAGAM